MKPFEIKSLSQKILKDHIIVFTGQFVFFDDSILQKVVLALGGTIATSVTANTTVLVVGYRHERESFLKKAAELDVQILYEDEFMRAIQDQFTTELTGHITFAPM